MAARLSHARLLLLLPAASCCCCLAASWRASWRGGSCSCSRRRRSFSSCWPAGSRQRSQPAWRPARRLAGAAATTTGACMRSAPVALLCRVPAVPSTDSRCNPGAAPCSRCQAAGSAGALLVSQALLLAGEPAAAGAAGAGDSAAGWPRAAAAARPARVQRRTAAGGSDQQQPGPAGRPQPAGRGPLRAAAGCSIRAPCAAGTQCGVAAGERRRRAGGSSRLGQRRARGEGATAAADVGRGPLNCHCLLACEATRRPRLLLLCACCAQAAAVACGSVYVPARDSSTSFSIFTVTPQMSAECGTAAALAAAGGSRASCARCPSLQPGVTYDLLLAASATGSSIKIGRAHV